MSEDNKVVVRRFLERVFTGGDLGLVDDIFAPDYALHDPDVPGEVRGPEGVRRYVAMYRGAYPDTRFAVEDQIAEGDRVVTRWTASGTHEGELMGIAPTGRVVTISGIEVDLVSGGRIAETWVVYDALGMMQQLGVVPVPG